MSNSYSESVSPYPKPGPFPVIPLSLHFRQDHCLEVRQQFLHHQVAQDLYGQEMKMISSHPALYLKAEHCNTERCVQAVAQLFQLPGITHRGFALSLPRFELQLLPYLSHSNAPNKCSRLNIHLILGV